MERYTPYRRVSAASDNVAQIKAGSGELGYVFASNINAAVRYLHFFDSELAPTLGTTVPILTMALPGAATGGLASMAPPGGILFNSGLWIAITTTVNGATGNVAANEQIVNAGWS
jgi:hypothetical protein